LKKVQKEVEKRCELKYDILQGYIEAKSRYTLRLRKSSGYKDFVLFDDPLYFPEDINYFLTLKKTVSGKVVEIESKIDERDFKYLWSDTTCRVTKERYICDGDWEVDIFKKKGKSYFALAELEMEEDEVFSGKMPDWIKNCCIYTVSKGDNRFSSKRLSNVKHCSDLLKIINNKNLDNNCGYFYEK